MARALGKVLLDLAPDESLVEQNIRAVSRMDWRATRLEGLFGVRDKRQRLIIDAQLFGRVLGLRARFSYDGGHPFTRIPGLTDSERIALHIRRIEAVHQGIDRGRQLLTGENVVHARHRQSSRTVDRDDAGRRMLRRQDRHVKHALKGDVGNIFATSCNETTILADAPVGRYETEGGWIGAHFEFSAATLRPRGAFDLFRRSAANSIASTICP